MVESAVFQKLETDLASLKGDLVQARASRERHEAEFKEHKAAHEET